MACDGYVAVDVNVHFRNNMVYTSAQHDCAFAASYEQQQGQQQGQQGQQQGQQQQGQQQGQQQQQGIPTSSRTEHWQLRLGLSAVQLLLRLAPLRPWRPCLPFGSPFWLPFLPFFVELWSKQVNSQHRLIQLDFHSRFDLEDFQHWC
jgi:hypothetical protein